MKKLTISTGGHPFYADDLSHLNDAIQELQAAMAIGPRDAVWTSPPTYYLTDPAIYTNGENTGISNAGYMVYKGEVCAYDAQSIATVGGQTLAWVPDTTYLAIDPVTYADASGKSPHVIKKVKLQFYAVAPADYVNTANLRKLRGEWLAIAPINGWTAENAFWRISYGGLVEMKGKLTAPTPVVAQFADLGLTIAQERYVAAVGLGMISPFTTPIQIDADGDCFVDTNEVTDGNELHLDGVSFYV